MEAEKGNRMLDLMTAKTSFLVVCLEAEGERGRERLAIAVE